VGNESLELKKETWDQDKKNISHFELNNRLKGMKRVFEWLKFPPSQALQQVGKNLDFAFKSFFKGNGGYPKFKKKGRNESFRLPQGFSILPQLSNKIGVVKLPKVGEVKFIKSREVEGIIKFVTISKKLNEWYISFTCELEINIEERKDGSQIGIDRGIAKLVQCSDGKDFAGISVSKKEKRKLKKLQQKQAGQEKFSSNWKKTGRKIQKIYFHVSNRRKDYVHKISTQLANNHSIIVMEKLNVAGMTKSAKGTIENPGKNVKAKSGLNRSILEQGWSLFQLFLEYKMLWKGGKVIYVDPKYTSQKCSRCGHISKDNRKSQAVFKCTKCGYELNADLNASKNILAEGHSVIACGEEALVSSVKQELGTRKPLVV